MSQPERPHFDLFILRRALTLCTEIRRRLSSLSTMRHSWVQAILDREQPVSLLIVVYLLCLLGAAQFAPPGVPEHDSYFHARFANLLPQRGLSRHFPWTQVSTWKDSFCDKEFLFHLALVPFTLDDADPIRGAQVFTFLLDLLLLLILYQTLKTQKVRWPILYVFLLTCMGAGFLIRLSMVRSHVMSIACLLLGLQLLLTQRLRYLAVLSFFFAWTYTFPMAMVILAVAYAGGRYLSGEELAWKPPLLVLGSVVAGLIVHPYSPLTLETFFTYLQVLKIGFAGKDEIVFELGREMYTYPTRIFFLMYPLLHLSFAGVALWGLGSRKKIEAQTMGCLVVAFVWFGLALFFARFIEYAVPFAVLALGLVVKDLTRPGEGLPATPALAAGRKKAMLLIMVVLTVLGCHLFSIRDYFDLVGRANPPRFAGAATWMEKHLDAQETVLNLFWDEFPELFYQGARQHYIWALDPTYTIRFDREKANLLEKVRRQDLPINGPQLAMMFRARYLIMSKTRFQKMPQLLDGILPIVYKDNEAVIISLGARK
jgi:hypothetical protein